MSDDHQPLEPPSPEPKRAFGEIDTDRPTWLSLVVLAVAILLAVAPFLYMKEANPFAQAIAMYDELCNTRNSSGPLRADFPISTQLSSHLQTSLEALHCPERLASLPEWKKTASSPERYTLLFLDPKGKTILEKLCFIRIDGILFWDDCP